MGSKQKYVITVRVVLVRSRSKFVWFAVNARSVWFMVWAVSVPFASFTFYAACKCNKCLCRCHPTSSGMHAHRASLHVLKESTQTPICSQQVHCTIKYVDSILGTFPKRRIFANHFGSHSQKIFTLRWLQNMLGYLCPIVRGEPWEASL